MASSKPKEIPKPDKIVVDPLHGDIHLSPQEWDVVDTASFQRLRRLKQLQMGQVAYPNATHTRFAHSLGVLGIMGRIIQIAKQSIKITKETAADLRLAALLHDIGHYPYSHLMELVDRVTLTEEFVEGNGGKKTLTLTKKPYPNHEALGKLIVSHQPDLVSVLGGKNRAKRIANLFSRDVTADSQISKLIHSSLDMDRLDYLLRDARAAGVPFGQIDLNYILNNLKSSPSGILGVAEKALPAVEQFLFARFFMYRTVYYHKTTFGIEEACRQLLRRIRDRGLYDIAQSGESIEQIVTGSELGAFTDAYVDRIVHQATTDQDIVIRSLANCIHSRRPPRLLKEVHVLRENSQDHHAGVTFKQNCKTKLKTLAAKHKIPLGQFLACDFKPIKFEERAGILTSDEAKKLKPEEREELIKIFVGADAEPKSIVDIPHSIISICARHSFQTVRLYVIENDVHRRNGAVEDMRKEVRNWDKPV